MEFDHKKEQENLDKYCEENWEYIDKLYEQYLELANKIGVAEGWIWGKEQLGALMMVAEEKYYSLMENLEFQLEKNGQDPFANPKLVSYIISKGIDKAILLMHMVKDKDSIFILNEVPINIMEIAKENDINKKEGGK
jgi:hypothetical protein